MENFANETNPETFNQSSASVNPEFAPSAEQSAPVNDTASIQTAAVGNTTAVPPIYDGRVNQRFPFSVKEDGELIKSAHILKPVGDAAHLAYLREVVRVRDGEDTGKTMTELTAEFWRDHLIESIENLAVGPDEDFRDVPDAEEEIVPLAVGYLTVVVKPAMRSANRKRSPIKTNRQTITTQAFFNGEPVEQRHVLRKGDELRKKYNRISRSQYVENKNKEGEAVLKFVPAYEDKIKLYDEMFIETSGFVNNIIPARFKLVALDAVFESSVIDAKK